MIHAITRSLVFTSGAGTSESGPRVSMMAEVYRRVTRSSSALERLAGSQTTPPGAAETEGAFGIFGMIISGLIIVFAIVLLYMRSRNRR